jgi:hypothetical protein
VKGLVLPTECPTSSVLHASNTKNQIRKNVLGVVKIADILNDKSFLVVSESNLCCLSLFACKTRGSLFSKVFSAMDNKHLRMRTHCWALF